MKESDCIYAYQCGLTDRCKGCSDYKGAFMKEYIHGQKLRVRYVEVPGGFHDTGCVLEEDDIVTFLKYSRTDGFMEILTPRDMKAVVPDDIVKENLGPFIEREKKVSKSEIEARTPSMFTDREMGVVE